MPRNSRASPLEPDLDAAVMPDPRSQMILVTTRVIELGQRVAAGDMAAAAEVSALAALLERERG